MQNNTDENIDKVVPKVPIKTYLWEDIRRQKRDGLYPWTHFQKEPSAEASSSKINNIDFDTACANYYLQKNPKLVDQLVVADLQYQQNSASQIDNNNRMDEQRISIPIDECPELNLEEATSLDDISLYLDKEQVDPSKASSERSSNAGVYTHVPLLKTYSQKQQKRAKSEEFSRHRRASSTSSKRRKTTFISTCMKKIKSKLHASENDLQSNTVTQEGNADVRPIDAKPKPISDTLRKNAKPVYIRIPLKPPPGEIDEFSHLEYEPDRRQSEKLNQLSPVLLAPPTGPAMTRSFDNVYSATQMEGDSKRRKRRYSVESPDDIVAFEILKSEPISVKHHSTSELNVNGTTQNSDIYIIQPNCDNIEPDDVAIIILDGDDISSSSNGNTNKQQQRNTPKYRAKSAEPEKRRQPSVDSGYSRKSLSKLQWLKQKITKQTIGRFDSFKRFRSGKKMETDSTHSLGTNVNVESPSESAPDATAAELNNNKKKKSKSSGPIYIPLKPPPGESDEFSYLEFDESSAAPEQLTCLSEDIVPTTAESTTKHIILLTPPSNDELQYGTDEINVPDKSTTDWISTESKTDGIAEEKKETYASIIPANTVSNIDEDTKSNTIIDSKIVPAANKTDEVIVDEEDGLATTCELIRDKQESEIDEIAKKSTSLTKKVSFKRRSQNEATIPESVQTTDEKNDTSNKIDMIVNKWSNISDHEYAQIDGCDEDRSQLSTGTHSPLINKLVSKKAPQSEVDLCPPTPTSCLKHPIIVDSKSSANVTPIPTKSESFRQKASNISQQFHNKIKLHTNNIKSKIQQPKSSTIHVSKSIIPSMKTIKKKKEIASRGQTLKVSKQTPDEDSKKITVTIQKESIADKGAPKTRKSSKMLNFKEHCPVIISKCKKVQSGLDKFISKNEKKITEMRRSKDSKTTLGKSEGTVSPFRTEYRMPRNGVPKRKKRKAAAAPLEKSSATVGMQAMTPQYVVDNNLNESIHNQFMHENQESTDMFQAPAFQLSQSNSFGRSHYRTPVGNSNAFTESGCVFEEINSDEYLLRQRDTTDSGDGRYFHELEEIESNRPRFFQSQQPQFTSQLDEYNWRKENQQPQYLAGIKPIRKKRKNRLSGKPKEMTFKPYYHETAFYTHTTPTSVLRPKRRQRKTHKRLYENIDDIQQDKDKMYPTKSKGDKIETGYENISIFPDQNTLKMESENRQYYPTAVQSRTMTYPNIESPSDRPSIPLRKHKSPKHFLNKDTNHDFNENINNHQAITEPKQRSLSYCPLQYDDNKTCPPQPVNLRSQSMTLQFPDSLNEYLATKVQDSSPTAHSTPMNTVPPTIYATIGKDKRYAPTLQQPSSTALLGPRRCQSYSSSNATHLFPQNVIRPPRRRTSSIRALDTANVMVQPGRPPRKSQRISSSSSKLHDMSVTNAHRQRLAGPHEIVQGFEAVPVSTKMKDRPLPAPPRPPRRGRQVALDGHGDLLAGISYYQTDDETVRRSPSEPIILVDEGRSSDGVQRIQTLLTPTHYTYEETVTHAALIVEPLNNLNLHENDVTADDGKAHQTSSERIITVDRECDDQVDGERGGSVDRHNQCDDAVDDMQKVTDLDEADADPSTLSYLHPSVMDHGRIEEDRNIAGQEFQMEEVVTPRRETESWRSLYANEMAPPPPTDDWMGASKAYDRRIGSPTIIAGDQPEMPLVPYRRRYRKRTATSPASSDGRQTRHSYRRARSSSPTIREPSQEDVSGNVSQ